ncbi:MAG: dTMP kinase [Anaerovoracaceae bacterium]
MDTCSRKGIFISIEGPDGSGKSTQIENIKSFFAEKHIDVLFTREPGGTAIGERIREIILDKNCTEMDYMTEAMLYAASRAQHVSQVIRPALAEGKVIVCDRFVDSSIAYQGYGRKLGEAVRIINNYAVDGCMPDVTFLLKVDPRVGKGRITCRGEKEDRLDAEKAAFHEDVYQGYLQLEKDYPERIVGIDASGSIEEIKAEICRKLEEVLNRVTE